ncbi:MAG TPA: DUF2063 domain-containing protein, partial [Janthinobacterium sp.]|nr:DUF2063 domain-containing protein [Janthinobacterium sp.]
MSALHALQADFQDYVLGDGAVAPAMAAAVCAQPGLGVAARLAIYHNAYRARMREALAEAYDKTWSYVGDDMFADLAAGYLAAHPSRFRNLRWFGGDFAAHAALALPDYPFIAELARFEWSLGLAFDAADVAPLVAADFGALAPHEWGGLTFGLHPSLHMLELHWNAVALWQALDAAGEPPEAERVPGAVCWLVWRHAGQPHFRSLEPPEAD